jgi:hypothetical protein
MLSRPYRFVLIAFAALALPACASRGGGGSEPAPDSAAAGSEEAVGTLGRVGRNTGQAVSGARRTAAEGIPDAAGAPLEDLNITRDEIPESLAAVTYVYTAYPPPDCSEIAAELAALGVDLGRDYDDDAEEAKSLGQKAGDAAGDLIVDTIRGVTTDVIPFRSIVREASGAAAFERRRARAFASGYARRAYLKGLALGQGCEPPAAPLVITPPPPEEEVADANE